ncbi:hypothetical protein [Caryophanon latum]|uniref:Uncharacterized protein n=1 Tax=Caryophanon latum TaxID=33977 RepID=A0A1C0YTC1_9BACL|nr:hypothetical protein [Caryophanon latum]OCS90402.1 hypothetical protein A6K76_11085 [Caryophanon latum]
MEHLRQQLAIRSSLLIPLLIALIVCIVVTPIPTTALFLPIIAYFCMRLYKQLQHEQLDAFSITFELGCILFMMTLFIAAHRVMY